MRVSLGKTDMRVREKMLFLKNAPAEGIAVPLTVCKKGSRSSPECFQFLVERVEEKVRLVGRINPYVKN